jgi:hypothetical protein
MLPYPPSLPHPAFPPPTTSALSIHHAQAQSWVSVPALISLFSVLNLQKAVIFKGTGVWRDVGESDHGLFHLKGLRKITKTLLKISGLQNTKYVYILFLLRHTYLARNCWYLLYLKIIKGQTRISVFLNIMACSLVERYQCFGGTCPPPPPQILVPLNQTTRHIPEVTIFILIAVGA